MHHTLFLLVCTISVALNAVFAYCLVQPAKRSEEQKKKGRKEKVCVQLGRFPCHSFSFSYKRHSGILAYRLPSHPLSSSLPSLQSLSSFDSHCVPPSSPCYSCTRHLHISRRGAVSLVAVVVALEYSCLASQHNSEIREPEHCAS